jgi:GTP-binding protein Era
VSFRAGTVALVGRPNAGKSTLLNAVLGEKLAITSPKPQTTRQRIVGVRTTADAQYVLVDAPGIHPARSRLNRAMVGAATTAMRDVDVICLVVDSTKAVAALRANKAALSRGDAAVAKMVEDARPGRIVVALNKVDQVEKAWLLPLVDAWAKRLPGAAIVPISALRRDGLDALLGEWRAGLHEGPPLYPDDVLTDQSERFFVAELIREKIVKLTEQELPYATAVEIEQFDESQREGRYPRVEIFARILVERESQKGIVIGKRGSRLKKIGTLAREDIEKLLGVHVRLDLHVVVREEWTDDPRVLRTLGLDG